MRARPVAPPEGATLLAALVLGGAGVVTGFACGLLALAAFAVRVEDAGRSGALVSNTDDGTTGGPVPLTACDRWRGAGGENG